MAKIRKWKSKNVHSSVKASFGFSKYFKAVWQVVARFQPFFSIFVALLVCIPLAYAITLVVPQLQTIGTKNEFHEGVVDSMHYVDPFPQTPLDAPFSQLNRDVTRRLFDPLFVSDAEGTPVGAIADKYTITDSAEKFTITLKNRQWSDGQTIKSSDVVDTFNLIKKLGGSSIYSAAVDGVKISAQDDSTVVFQLDAPNSAFLETLSWPVLPSAQITLDYTGMIQGEFGRNPITSTGWSIKKITANNISLKSPQGNILEFIFYENKSSVEKAMDAGFIDGYYATAIPTDRKFTDMYKYILPRQIYSLYFNLTAGTPLKDPSLRKAISYAINRDEIANGIGEVQPSVINNKSWAYNPAVNTYPYNIDQGNKLLDNLGYTSQNGERFKNGQRLESTLSVPNIPLREDQANKIKDQLKLIGITVNVQVVKDSDIFENVLKTNLFYTSIVLTRNFEAMIYSVDSGLDPDKFSQWSSSTIPNLETKTIGLNFAGYTNERVNTFLFQGRKQTDQAARKTPYNQFQKVFYEDAPVVTLYNPYLFYVVNKKVKNVDFTGALRIEDRFINFDQWEF